MNFDIGMIINFIWCLLAEYDLCNNARSLNTYSYDWQN